MSAAVAAILEQIKSLSQAQQIELARMLDRLTWTHRWRAICHQIDARARAHPPLTDLEIDAAVRDVRRERPLSERSSTHPS